MKTIYVLGSLNMDLVIESDVLPDKGQTICGKNFSTCPGGKGLNQAIAAAKLGGKVKMLGAVGYDVFGQKLINALKKYNVDVTNVKMKSEIPSGIAMILLHENDNRIILDLGANLTLTKSDVDSFLADALEGDIFLTQLENDVEIVGYALQIAKEKKMMTVVNPAPSNPKILNFVNYIDILTPNSGELFDLLEGKSSTEDLNIHSIIETKGEDGYCIYEGSNKFSAPAVKVEVVDTTGAGDTFNGALCYRLSIERHLNKGVIDFACLAASISTTRKGSSISSPTLDEINKFKIKKTL